MMTLVRTKRRHLLLAALLLVGGAIAARAPGAIVYPLWQDEVASARILVEPTPWDAVARVADTESTPPGWYFAGWLLHRAGIPVEAVRWLSVLAGGAAAALTLVFARRFLSLPAAIGAGVVVALAWQLVARGHELRAYSLYLLLSLAFALALAEAARRPAGRRLAVLAGVVALGLLTHYFFALALVTGALWLLARARRDARAPAVAALAIGVVPLLAWLPGFFEQVANGRYSWVAGFDALKAAAVYSTFFWNADELYVETQDVTIDGLEAVARLGILGVVLAGAVVLWRRGSEARLAALLATVPVGLVTVLWLSGGAVFTTRNLICAAPFAAIAIAAALDALPRPAALAAAGATLCLLGVGLVQERTLRPPPYEAYADRVEELGAAPGDPVYVLGGAHSLSYLGSSYALRSPIAWYLPGHPELRLLEPPACENALVVDGTAEPVRVERVSCERIRPGGYWFEVTPSGGQSSPSSLREPHTTQSVVVKYQPSSGLR